jgi:hypothetical protein
MAKPKKFRLLEQRPRPNPPIGKPAQLQTGSSWQPKKREHVQRANNPVEVVLRSILGFSTGRKVTQPIRKNKK